MAQPIYNNGVVAISDIYNNTEDNFIASLANQILVLDVLANDRGSSKNVLYSIDDGDNALTDLVASNITTGWESTASGNQIRINNGKIEFKLADGFDINTLVQNEQYQDSFVYAIKLASGQLSKATVSVNLIGDNDLASITGTSTGGVADDGAQIASGTLTVSDIDRGEAHAQAYTSTINEGTFNVDVNGNWNFQLNNAAVQHLNSGVTQDVTFTVTSQDGTATQNVVITITGTNDTASIIGTATGALAEDDIAIIGGQLITSDVDDGEAHTQTYTSTINEGTFSIDADGNWNFQLNNAAVQHLAAGETLDLTFAVTSLDGTATQNVVITITGANEPASITGTATGDVADDGALVASGTLTVSDVDDGESHTQPYTSTINEGTFTVDANGNWDFLLNNAAVQHLAVGETQNVTFIVTSLDGTASQDVVITITGTNDGPVITSGDQAGGVKEDTVLTATGQVKSSDVDNNATATYSSDRTNGTYGSFVINALTGEWTYILGNEVHQSLKDGQVEKEIFTVTVTDDQGATANQDVTITITGTNDLASITGTATGDVADDGVQEASGTLTVSDVDDGEAHTQAYTKTIDEGTFTVDVNGNWDFLLNNPAVQHLAVGESQDVTFTVTSLDGTASQDVTITITGTNDGPVITSGDQAGDVKEDTVLTATGQVKSSDVDNGATATYSSDRTNGTYGSFVINALTGEWTYTLDNEAHQNLADGETQTETFTVTVTDDQGATATQDVTITITGTNDAATLSSDNVELAETDAALTTGGTLTISDIDSPAEFVAQTSLGENGTFSINAAGEWTYTANSAFDSLNIGDSVSDAFTVFAVDGTSTTVNVRINGTNDGPVAVADTAEAFETQVVSIDVLSNDSDVDVNSVLTLASVGVQGSRGSASIVDNRLVFDMNNDFRRLAVGQEELVTVNYTVSDENGATADSTASIIVKGSNDGPVAINDSASVLDNSVASGSVFADNGNGADYDIDNGDTIMVYSVNGQTSAVGSQIALASGALLILNQDGTYTYDPNGSFALSEGDIALDSFTYTIVDNHGATSTATVNLSVIGTQSDPVIDLRTNNSSGMAGSNGVTGYQGAAATSVSATPGTGGTGGLGAAGTAGNAGFLSTHLEGASNDDQLGLFATSQGGVGGIGGNGGAAGGNYFSSSYIGSTSQLVGYYDGTPTYRALFLYANNWSKGGRGGDGGNGGLGGDSTTSLIGDVINAYAGGDQLTLEGRAIGGAGGAGGNGSAGSDSGYSGTITTAKRIEYRFEGSYSSWEHTGYIYNTSGQSGEGGKGGNGANGGYGSVNVSDGVMSGSGNQDTLTLTAIAKGGVGGAGGTGGNGGMGTTGAGGGAGGLGGDGGNALAQATGNTLDGGSGNDLITIQLQAIGGAGGSGGCGGRSDYSLNLAWNGYYPMAASYVRVTQTDIYSDWYSWTRTYDTGKDIYTNGKSGNGGNGGEGGDAGIVFDHNNIFGGAGDDTLQINLTLSAGGGGLRGSAGSAESTYSYYPAGSNIYQFYIDCVYYKGTAGASGLGGANGSNVATVTNNLFDGGVGNDVISLSLTLPNAVVVNGQGLSQLIPQDSVTLDIHGNQFAGGDGFDVLDFSGLAKAGIHVNLTEGILAVEGSAGINQVSGIEKIIGTNQGDILIGSAQADVLDGQGGNDVLSGGNGGDTLTGGEGNDTAAYTGNMAGYAISVASGGLVVTDIDSADGDDGVDSLNGIETLSFADCAIQIAQFNEARVNTSTANHQFSSDVAALVDGGYVVTWHSSQDGSGYGIYAQRYGANGAAIGSEFRVNTTTANHQFSPAVTALADGGYVVTWQSYLQDGSSEGVYAQRYGANSAALGSEFRVNTYTPDGQEAPSVTSLKDGGFVVTWQSIQDGSGYGIYAQRYNANGAASGSEFRVNTTTLSNQIGSDVVALADGGYVVTWMSCTEYTSLFSGYVYTNWDIYAQRYSANGTALGSEIRVHTYTYDTQACPAITALKNGGYVVAWHSWQDGSGYGIYAQRYAFDGSAYGGEFRVNTTVASDQSSPAVTALQDGGYVVAWNSWYQDGSEGGIYAQRYHANGTAYGGEFRVNTTVAYDQSSPSVTALSDGGYVVTWHSMYQDGSGYGIYSQRYDVANNTISTRGDDNDNTLVWNNASAISLDGVAGNDILTGGAYNDMLTGGAGSDKLTGGIGADIFKFGNISDSGIGSGNRDIILDFSHAQADLIDFSQIDANASSLGTNEQFTWIDTAEFSNIAGELRYFVENSSNAIVEGDVDGNGSADFQVELVGVTTLQQADFVL